MPLPVSRLACALAVGNLLVSTVLLPLSFCQHIREHKGDFGFGDIDKDMFYDNHILVDGREETVYLFKGELTSFFYNVEEDGVPLSLVVTPCASNISFHLFMRSGADDTDSQENDPFLKDSRKLQLQSKPLARLKEFKGGGHMEYTSERARKGMYFLDLKALDTDTTVKMLGTSHRDSVQLYPKLPEDDSVKLTSKSKRSFSISWNPPEGENKGGKSTLEYCLSISRIQNFQSHCSALAHLRGDVRPTAPPHVGFGFDWEKSDRERKFKMAKPIKEASPRELYYKCIGTKTSYIYDKAKPGRTYYVDIFVIDRQTSRSSAYKGVVVKTDRRKRRNKVILEHKKRTTVTLHKGVRLQSVRLVLKKPVDKAVLELKACRGSLPFEILHNNKLFHKSKVRRIKIVRITNVPAGTYIIRFKGKRKRKRSVSVYFTTDSRRYRPPRLPVDHRIRVFNSLTNCTSVTLAWMANDVKQKYCLYKKEIDKSERVRKHRCSNPRSRESSEKVFCTRFRKKDPSKAVLTKTVTDLKPGTWYLFDVYVSRGQSVSLVYRNEKVRTKSLC